MKKIVMVTVFLFMSANALASGPSAALCRNEAVKGAAAIFNVNNKEEGQLSLSTELVGADHSEGSTEVWDVKFKKNNIDYSPYRMTVLIDECVVIGFSMPFAG